MSSTRQSCLFVLTSAVEGINQQHNIWDKWAQAALPSTMRSSRYVEHMEIIRKDKTTYAQWKTEHHGYIVYSFVWVRGKILLTWPRGHYFGFSRCGVLNVEAENITWPRPLSWPWRQLWGQNFDFGLILLAVPKALVLNLLPRPWGENFGFIWSWDQYFYLKDEMKMLRPITVLWSQDRG